jgi:hypothetical protein
MVIGHVGVAFAAKRVWPSVRMRTLLLATFAPDLLRMAFIPFGMIYSTESNTYTHGLPWCVLLAIAVGALAYKQGGRDAAVATFTLVLSHIALDFISGFKPLTPHGPIGMNLEGRSWQLEFLLESIIVIGGWLLWRGGQRSPKRGGGIVSLLVLGEFAMLMFVVASRPFAQRCLAYPYRRCLDQSPLTFRWHVSANPIRDLLGM